MSRPTIRHLAIKTANPEKLVAAGLPAAAMRPSNRPYAEKRGMDPNANLFDLSEHGYSRAEYRADREAKKKNKVEA